MSTLKLIRLYESRFFSSGFFLGTSIISASRSSTVHLSELFIFIVVKCIVNAFSKLIWMLPHFAVVFFFVSVRKCLFLSQFLSIAFHWNMHSKVGTMSFEIVCILYYKSIHTISFVRLFSFIAYSLFAHFMNLIFYVYFLFRFFLVFCFRCIFA